MPGFELSGRSEAPVEEVWKLLYDPSRFPEWWAGVETVRADDPDGRYVLWPTGYPDFPMPQVLRGNRAEGHVTISCQVSDLEFVWRLSEDGASTLIEVTVALPEREAHRLAGQRKVITDSLRRLAELAEAGGIGRPPASSNGSPDPVR
ncbi:MAG TPA: SRPBCC family protein [Pseudonocardia sp.]|nr:SRPBCC family protein [Pseudonocardia sp.]